MTPDAGYLDLVKLAHKAWELGVPDNTLPFCEDNGDYYCIYIDGSISFWSHNGWDVTRWPDLATWIKQLWIDEYLELENG